MGVYYICIYIYIYIYMYASICLCLCPRAPAAGGPRAPRAAPPGPA